MKAAILAGADAVYLGLDRFNARMRAGNLGLDELVALAELARDRDVRLYLTLNVLLAEDECAQALELARQGLEAGASAIIVQDLGLARMLINELDQVEIHASTQLTTHNSSQLRFLASMGISQVNFSRELSLAEVDSLAHQARELNLVPEVFVHGAYCISFSGQCYFSALCTGHSGNRGTCIQGCRREYQSSGGDGKSPARHPELPLNLKDNNALAMARELLGGELGSLKIEGRRKGLHYVYQTVRAWVLEKERILGPGPGGPRGMDIGSPVDPAKVFNRGFNSGYLAESVTADMFSDSGDDMSLEASGTILSYSADKKVLQVEAPSASLGKGRELSIFGEKDYFVGKLLVEEVFSPWEFKVRMLGEFKSHLKRGQEVFVHPELDRELEEAVRRLVKKEKVLDMVLSGRAGESMRGTFTLRDSDISITLKSPVILEPAASRPLDHESVLKQMGKLGGTGFELGSLSTSGIEGSVFMPVADLNAFRRDAIALLVEELSRKAIQGQDVIPARKPAVVTGPGFLPLPAKVSSARLAVICDSAAQAERHLDQGLVDLAFVDIGLTGQVLEAGGLNRLLGTSTYRGTRLLPWTQPILFEEDLASLLAQFQAENPGLAVCENSGLGFSLASSGKPWIAGTHLNVCNTQAALALAQGGAGAVLASGELGRKQLVALAQGLGGVDKAQRPKLWYRAFGPQLAMNTRQCLVRNAAGCPKEHTDTACLRTCAASAKLRGKGGEIQHVIKRPGQFNQLYLNTVHFNADSLSLRDMIDCYVLDLRDPGFLAMEDGVVDMLVAWFKAGLGGSSKPGPGFDELKAALPVWNRGLWDKGLAE